MAEDEESGTGREGDVIDAEYVADERPREEVYSEEDRREVDNGRKKSIRKGIGILLASGLVVGAGLGVYKGIEWLMSEEKSGDDKPNSGNHLSDKERVLSSFGLRETDYSIIESGEVRTGVVDGLRMQYHKNATIQLGDGEIKADVLTLYKGKNRVSIYDIENVKHIQWDNKNADSLEVVIEAVEIKPANESSMLYVKDMAFGDSQFSQFAKKILELGSKVYNSRGEDFYESFRNIIESEQRTKVRSGDEDVLNSFIDIRSL